MTNLFKYIARAGDVLVELFHLVGLFVIGGTIVWSAVHESFEITMDGVVRSSSTTSCS